MFERIGARLPVGQVGKPEDLANAYLYLYLTKTGFSTGETIVPRRASCRHRPGPVGRRCGMSEEDRLAEECPNTSPAHPAPSTI
jgi:hypothetical protein